MDRMVLAIGTIGQAFYWDLSRCRTDAGGHAEGRSAVPHGYAIGADDWGSPATYGWPPTTRSSVPTFSRYGIIPDGAVEIGAHRGLGRAKERASTRTSTLVTALAIGLANRACADLAPTVAGLLERLRGQRPTATPTSVAACMSRSTGTRAPASRT